jgi:beta-glucuronidase
VQWQHKERAMSTRSRRRFVAEVAVAGAAALAPRAAVAAAAPPRPASARPDERIPLDGAWDFRLDAENLGDKDRWNLPDATRAGWTSVTVPHTWQIEADSAEYYGVAWYRRRFAAPPEWRGACVRVEFQAVFHSASVWVNGRPAGEHLRKGYTGFTIDITSALRWDGGPNVLVVRVENTFDDQMLPRGRSSDWTHDGGIYRPVTLLVSPPVYIEGVVVDAVPGGSAGAAAAAIRRRAHPAEPWATRSSIRKRAKRCCGSCGLARSASPRANR